MPLSFALIVLSLFAIPYGFNYFLGDKGKLETDTIDSHTSKTVLCHDGYQYLLVTTGFGAGLTQMFENGPNGIRALECQRKNTNKP